MKKYKVYPFKGNEINYIFRFLVAGLVVIPSYLFYIVLFSFNYILSFSLKCVKSIIFTTVDVLDIVFPLRWGDNES